MPTVATTITRTVIRSRRGSSTADTSTLRPATAKKMGANTPRAIPSSLCTVSAGSRGERPKRMPMAKAPSTGSRCRAWVNAPQANPTTTTSVSM